MRWQIVILCLMSSLHCNAQDERFTVIGVDLKKENLEIFLKDELGKPYKRFEYLAAWLKTRNKKLQFAMNAGMFHQDLSPVGLLVLNGKEITPINLGDGAGNFYLKPNGVFIVTKTEPKIIDSTEYPAQANGVWLATQSGPMLVKKGVVHPALNPNSTSRLIRNGVGVSGGKVFFVISEQPVTFYELAIFFKNGLHCPDALYLDGVISSLYLPDRNRKDFKVELGPILGVVQ